MIQLKFNSYFIVLTCLLVSTICLLSSTGFGQTESQIITVPLAQVDTAKWDEYGPGYEGDPLSTDSICWMRAVGSISFKFDIDKLKKRKNALVSVKISSELAGNLQGTVNGDPKYSSDVTLFVNNVELLTQNVIADDKVGRFYVWKIPIDSLKKGENTITFTVKKEAENKNGLSFFAPIKIQLR